MRAEASSIDEGASLPNSVIPSNGVAGMRHGSFRHRRSVPPAVTARSCVITCPPRRSWDARSHSAPLWGHFSEGSKIQENHLKTLDFDLQNGHLGTFSRFPQKWSGSSPNYSELPESPAPLSRAWMPHTRVLFPNNGVGKSVRESLGGLDDDYLR